MDTAIVIAALILNPIAKRKRASETSEAVQMAEAPTILSNGSGSSSSPEKSDLESGGGLVADKNMA